MGGGGGGGGGWKNGKMNDIQVGPKHFFQFPGGSGLKFLQGGGSDPR
jgi:hypothetical protein